MEPHNTDGIDPGSGSSDIWIHHVHISNGDDSVAIKPSTPCTRNILVEDSTFEHVRALCALSATLSGLHNKVLLGVGFLLQLCTTLVLCWWHGVPANLLASARLQHASVHNC